MAARRQFARNRGPRRLTWARATSAAQITVAASSKVLIQSFTLDNPGISETVRRTRGNIWVQSDQSAAVENQFGAFGIIRVSAAAAAIGATAIPGPATDASDDGWFVWQGISQSSSLAAGGGPTGYHYMFDSKAMRAVEEGFVLAIMAENSSASNGYQIALAVALLSSRS